MGLLFIDLDHFKEINDTQGHGVGDMVLRHIAEKLSRNVRAGDLVTRLGGDEFTVILGNLRTADHAHAIAEKLLTELHRPFIVDDRIIKISCSIGISIYPEDGNNAEALLAHADEAMYQVKERGRDGIERFNRPGFGT
jgi:diguanylate cyclase (GGDEF)-like protein